MKKRSVSRRGDRPTPRRVLRGAIAVLVGGGLLAALPAAAASAAVRQSSTWKVATLLLPAKLPPGALSTRDIVVVRPASGRETAQLGRITAIVRSRGGITVRVRRVPSSALRPLREVVDGRGRPLSVRVGLAGRGAGAVGRAGFDPSPSCSDASGSISGSLAFSPSAGGSLGVTWVNVWEGIIWAPEISGSISFSPNLSMSLGGFGFSGSCENDFSAAQEEIASIDTFAGPLSLCFGAGGEIGASVSGTLDQEMYGDLGGSIGTNFHFGFTGAGLNPFNDISASGSSSSPSTSFSGSVYVGGGPYLDAEWGVCDVAGVGVQAGLNDTFTLAGSSSGWTAGVSESVNAAVNLNLLDYSYSQTIANWNLFSVQLASGGWPSSGGDGGGGGCALPNLRAQVIAPC